ncbi:MAG: asparagine--tRNA ligase [Deltaproteobacteria bacterium RIFOXYD12_FULL_57_12]|nr:MAG: asparagine--tRNA ligase [Deltaproteobacteria bacterium RIFOXYD12_FULL_57_12]
MNSHQRIADLLKTLPIGRTVEVKGWVKTRRDAKDLSFLEINDGSCLANLQVLASPGLANFATDVKKITTGCSLRVKGELARSPAKGQEVELQAREIEVYGWAPAESYPLQKKHHSFEFLRSIAHLRPRTNSLGSVARIRSALSFAVHRFFQEQGFYYVHTPIITTSDCEGAGEMFTVTALDLDNPPRTATGRVDFAKDFFGRPASLTVSGQLEAEVYALALGRVYTFGPTFRAENSNTSRHLAEFWMIEPEMAFCDLQGDIDVAEALLKYLIAYALEHCQEDIELFNRFIDKELIAKLSGVLEQEFARISYTEAVERLQRAGRAFEFPVSWGIDLQSEHERYLTEEIFKRPLVVTDYPRAIKPFYMRVNDEKTVAAMDILFPGLGEMVGGSQREERYDMLLTRMTETGVNPDDYQWYLDLRRFGTAPHAGFGLGFERLIQFVTGMANIREVIPFPRTPGAAAL